MVLPLSVELGEDLVFLDGFRARPGRALVLSPQVALVDVVSLVLGADLKWANGRILMGASQDDWQLVAAGF